MPHPPQPPLPLDENLLRPGLRLAVAVSGGADSVALLRTLAARAGELGLVLHVAHLHHGLRGAEADADLDFVRTLSAQLGLPFHTTQIDTPALAAADPASRKPSETIEEAARRLRYQWFRQLMASGAAEAVATAHTLDDQAETVLAKFLRGAWTEGLSGIHPVLDFPEGRILRPFLNTTRAAVEAYLNSLAQPWREDSSNRHLTFTRNRIRHQLLPSLESWNPRLRDHLAQMAELARDDEAFWSGEVLSAATRVLLSGRPVRGGGRAASEGLALDVAQLSSLQPALQRRVLRHAAEQLGFALDFPATESLRTLARTGRAGQKAELAGGLRGERTHRELRLGIQPAAPPPSQTHAAPSELAFPVPGPIDAPAFGVHLHIHTPTPSTATLRPWKPGDRVHLRHSSGPRKIKEILERMKVSGAARAQWPVLEIDGRIVWMQGVLVEPQSGIQIIAPDPSPASSPASSAAAPVLPTPR